jgi:hypothetical protein
LPAAPVEKLPPPEPPADAPKPLYDPPPPPPAEVIVPNTLLSPITPEDVEVPAVIPPPAPTVTVIAEPDETASSVFVL